jgi:translocation and assembly module TamA
MAALTIVLAAQPVAALEIFGIRIFGNDGNDAVIDVIDPQPYRLEIDRSRTDGDQRDVIRAASALVLDQGRPASGAAGLIAKARGDYSRLLAAFYDAGYYGAAISITIDGVEASEADIAGRLSNPAAVRIVVDPGPRFRFGQTGFVNPPPVGGFRDRTPDEARREFAGDGPARAGVIRAAAQEAIDAWREAGHPLAAVAGEDLVADHDTQQLDASVTLDPGPRAVMGSTTVIGATRVRRDFIAWMAEIPRGAEYDPSLIARAERRMARLGTFRSFRVNEADGLEADGSLPVSIEVEDRPLRRIGFGATLSSTEGLGLEGFWLHRNLFGRAESLRLDGSINDIGGSEGYKRYDYRLGASFVRPGTFTQDADLTVGFELEQQVIDIYRERSITASIGLTRIVNELLKSSAGFEAQYSRFQLDGSVSFESTTYSLPLTAEYDRRDDPTDATEGYFLSGELRPFLVSQTGANGVYSLFEARAYRALDPDRRLVLAGRAKIGSIEGAAPAETPPDLLFLAGGGASVRGYEYRDIGVRIAGAPVGGQSLLEASAEIRYRLTPSIGVVGFTDVAYVSRGGMPDSDGELAIGAGAGLRYQTGIGPIRLDVATPLRNTEGQSRFALYVGIGQAF